MGRWVDVVSSRCNDEATLPIGPESPTRKATHRAEESHFG